MSTTPPDRGVPRDRGSVATEMALIAPLLLAFLLCAIGIGRLVSARLDVDEASHEAARAASLARSPAAARAAAQQAADASAASAGLACPRLTTTVDTADYRPGGTVTVSVTCTAALSDLTNAPLPGRHTVRATSTSVIDTFRAEAPQ